VSAVACAILAAGGSRRLGRAKQLVPIAGKPLVRHVVDRVKSRVFVAVGVVVGAHAEEVSAAVAGSGADVIPNVAWEHGMASSIRAAVRWAADARADAIAIALCDQPHISAEHLERLVARWSEGSPIVASSYAQTVGVPAVFDRRLFAELRMLEGDRGAASVIRSHAAAASIAWPEGAVDLDTEESLRDYDASY
jgi:CTP:molybdopterin cytidylyltransferase MocA